MLSTHILLCDQTSYLLSLSELNWEVSLTTCMIYTASLAWFYLACFITKTSKKVIRDLHLTLEEPPNS